MLTFKISVNKITDTPSDTVTTRERNLFCPSAILPPTITGRSEIVHGARTVRTPAKNEISRSNM